MVPMHIRHQRKHASFCGRLLSLAVNTTQSVALLSAQRRPNVEVNLDSKPLSALRLD